MNEQIEQGQRLLLEKIIIDAHGEGLKSELREQMISDLYGRLQGFLLTALLKALPEKYADDYDKLMTRNPGQAEIEEFFTKNISDVNSVMAQAMLDFKQIYLDATKKDVV